MLRLMQSSFCLFMFFFFSSRRRHTRFDCDWSSDVCSSDLLSFGLFFFDYDLDGLEDLFVANGHIEPDIGRIQPQVSYTESPRSEERRVGKECRSRWSPYH